MRRAMQDESSMIHSADGLDFEELVKFSLIHWMVTLMRACITAGVHYLDIANWTATGLPKRWTAMPGLRA
jgi:hypothetical protein